jgi:phage shock protein C
MNKLYRDRQNAILGGVCAGLAQYLKIDVTVIRIVFIILGVMEGFGILAYLILWILLPTAPSANSQEKKDSTTNHHYIAGIILVALGAILLAGNFLQEFHLIEKLWPIIIVGIGLGILLKHNK